jgi:general secretion pathway protein G
MRHRAPSAGFTLMEIVIVVLIIGLLTALVVPTMINRYDDSLVQTAKTQIKSFDTALKTFRLDTGRYPSTAEGLGVLIPPPPTGVRRYDPEGYIEDVPLDPWDNPYEYSSDGKSFQIVSYGRDGETGGEGIDADLSNRRLSRAPVRNP